MTTLKLFQVDAFATKPFEGNPAAVAPLGAWLDDATLQAIAAENNLSETAFFVPAADGVWDLRWFTPAVEVDLCGHATLASAHVLFNHLGHAGDVVNFDTRSGRLTVTRDPDGLLMDLPQIPWRDERAPAEILAALGGAPKESWALKSVHGRDYWLALYESEAEIAALAPDFRALGRSGANALVTAPGDKVDLVSRFFAPGSGIDEDPVTGSAHATLAPFWTERLGARRLTARQLSARGGSLTIEAKGDRALLIGRCADYLVGEIKLPQARG